MPNFHVKTSVFLGSPIFFETSILVRMCVKLILRDFHTVRNRLKRSSRHFCVYNIQNSAHHWGISRVFLIMVEPKTNAVLLLK